MRIEFITEDLSAALAPKKTNIRIEKGSKSGEILLYNKNKKTRDGTVKIYNYLGDKLDEQNLTFENGRAKIKSTLPLGMYILSIVFKTGEKQSLKLIVKKEKARTKLPGPFSKTKTKKKLVHYNF